MEKLFKKALIDEFMDEALFGFASVDKMLLSGSHYKTVLVTLLPFPDLKYKYNPIEFYSMSEALRKGHSEKLNKIKIFLDNNSVVYSTPPAAPKDDGEYRAEFSYKWAAMNAGLGFIGKNDVFVSCKYGQRVRISCLFIDIDIPTFSGEIKSMCGYCNACVDACPHGFIAGINWDYNKKRNELVDYKQCATKSNHDKDGQKYLCANCVMACNYPYIVK